MKSNYKPLKFNFRFSLLMLILTMNVFLVKAQNITNYSFAPSAGTFTPISGGTVVPLSGGSFDDGYYNSLPIGFNFIYMGVSYNNFSASTNGWMTLGQPITLPASANALATGVTRPVIAPLWDDNEMDLGTLTYQTSGTVGNQVLTIEWLNVKWRLTATAPVVSFQVKLYEATGAVQFVYRQEAGTVTTGTASIGITGTGTGAGNYLSLNNSGTAPTVSSTTETTGISTKPATGQTYTFTPPVAPAAPSTFSASAIAIASMTISWTDNSTNERGFYIYRSTDNVNFSLAGTVASTSVATTGNIYSMNQTGLVANTTYYYNIVAFNEGWFSPLISGNATTLPAVFCGNRTVGPTGDYLSLTNAFTDIALNGLSCSSILELQPAYVSTVETFPLNVPSLGNSPSVTLTVRPEAGATNLLITSSAAQTLNMDGANGVIFDGRAGGIGSSQLTIENTSVTGSAISFINNASYNSFHDLTIKGVNNTATSGVITFLGSTSLSGNSFNTIQNNNISDGTSTPNNLIYSSGSALALNTGNTITNNNLFNFFNAGSSSAAVYLAANNTDWSVSNNRIYQQNTRTYTTAAQHYGIRIVAANGNNFTINNNIIGYTSNLSTGVYTMTGTVSTRFSAIALTSGIVTASNIQGNLIRNFSLTTSSTTATGEGVFAGIAVLGGSVNIGTTASNIIGSVTENDVISITSTASAGAVVGIYSTSTGTMNIVNNKVGGLSASGTAAMANTIRGINTVGTGDYTITSNEIGSAVLADNIRAGILGTTTANTDVTGIENTASGSHTISNNTITNISSYGSGTGGQVRGLSTTSGTSVISNNIISYLTSSATSTGLTTTASVIGLQKSGTAVDQSVINNTIFNLLSLAPSAAVSVNGIYYSGATTGTNLVNANSIRNLNAVTSGLGLINGINIGGGSSTFSNNMITLGLDAAGASITSGSLSFNGIRLGTTAANNIYFNSVNITGSGVTTGTTNTQAFIRTSTGVTDIKNNIFVNSRTNSTGSGKHYTINLNVTTTVTAANNNYYYPSAIMGIVGTTEYLLLGDWKVGTGIDISSRNVNPMFISATNLHIDNSSPSSLESSASAVSITTDFDGDVRPGPVGSVNGGGTSPDIGADEFDGIPVSLDMGATVIINPLTTGCYDATETIKVRIKNYGGATIDFSSNPITVNVQASGPNPVTFTPVDIYSGTLAAGATLDTTITVNYSMTTAGIYNFSAATVLSGDANVANDSAFSSVNITAGNASASFASICNGGSTVLSLSGQNGTLQWQSSPDGLVWTNENGTGNNATGYVVSPTTTTQYRALVCGLHPSDTVSITVITPAAPSTVDTIRCGPGQVNLHASGTGTLLWYDAPTAGNMVNVGNDYSPVISATTSYYVSNITGGVTERVGKTNQGTSSFISALKYGVLFTVTSPVMIDTVHVYPTGTGTISIEILDPVTQTVMYTAPAFNVSGTGTQKIAVPVGIALAPGSYKMSSTHTGITNLIRTLTGGPFPYTSPSGAVSITSGATGTSTSTAYYWFYDWVITTGCESPRSLVTATVTTPPAMSLSATSSSICVGNNTTITANSANPYTYTWSPAATLSASTGASVVATPTTTTQYTVNAIDANGCANSDAITITVNAIPTVTMTATPSAICLGNSSQLAARSLHLQGIVASENFNVAPSGWTITNTSTPAGLQWQFVSDFEGNSLNGTGFAFVDSDSPGSSSVVNSVLTSPVIDLTGYDSLALSFDQYYRHLASTIAKVEVYNGTAWIQIYNPTATAGSWTTPNSRSFNVTPYANAAFQVRFSYFGNFDYYWAIDNLKISSFADNNFSWSGAGLSSTTISNPVATPTATTMYYLTITDQTTSCVKTDSIQVTVNPNPVVTLGADTTICSNQNVTLNAGTFTSYAWSNSATTSTITVNTSGNYGVMVTDINGCTDTDTVAVIVNTIPAVSLGSDTDICAGLNVTLTPGNTFSSYNWSTGETTASIVAATAGNYYVTVTDANNCQNTDTVAVTVNPLPIVALGSDVTFCQNDSASLDAGAGFVSYNWSNSASSQTINVFTAGNYFVIVTDNNGCTNSDSVSVTVNALPAIDLGTALSFCMNDSLVLDAGSGFTAYVWSDNSTAQTLTVNAAGTYYASITDNNGCINSDTVSVSVNPLPVVNLGADLSLCMNSSAVIDAGTGFSTYFWSDNSSGQTLTVTSAGTYSVQVTDNNGCEDTDTVSVTVNALPVIDLGADVLICENETATLDAGAGFTGYLWNNNETTQTLFVDGSLLTAGNYSYSVIVSDGNGCEAADTVMVTVDLCTGVNESVQSVTFSIYPNPSQGQFTISSNNVLSENVSLELTDIEGRVVYKENVTNFSSRSIQLDNPSPGMYFLRILVDGKMTIQKININ
jgi:hypothetical protein